MTDDETTPPADGGVVDSDGSGDRRDPLDDATRAALSAIRQPLADYLHSQSEMLRRTLEPITQRLAQQHAEMVRAVTPPALANIDFDGVVLPAVSKIIAVQLPKIEFPAVEALQAQIARAFGSIDFGSIERLMLRGCPPNWQDLDGVRLWELFDLTEEGLPTAWVPRAEILKELVEATIDDRVTVFAARRSDIIEDCRGVLKDVTSSALVELVDNLDEALTVAAEGHLAAAQSLAASIFDTILRHTIKPQRISGYYAKVKAEITDRHENASIAELRWGLVHVPAILALEVFDQPRGHPVPASFNRHATAHAVGAVQYTAVNAGIALALATSLIREAHQEIVDSATPSTT